MNITHHVRPLSFSDIPGYHLTVKSNIELDGIYVIFDVEVQPYYGCFQKIPFISCWSRPEPYTERFRGCHVWTDSEGTRVNYSLESALRDKAVHT